MHATRQAHLHTLLEKKYRCKQTNCIRKLFRFAPLLTMCSVPWIEPKALGWFVFKRYHQSAAANSCSMWVLSVTLCVVTHSSANNDWPRKMHRWKKIAEGTQSNQVKLRWRNNLQHRLFDSVQHATDLTIFDLDWLRSARCCISSATLASIWLGIAPGAWCCAPFTRRGSSGSLP